MNVSAKLEKFSSFVMHFGERHIRFELYARQKEIKINIL